MRVLPVPPQSAVNAKYVQVGTGGAQKIEYLKIALQKGVTALAHCPKCKSGSPVNVGFITLPALHDVVIPAHATLIVTLSKHGWIGLYVELSRLSGTEAHIASHCLSSNGTTRAPCPPSPAKGKRKKKAPVDTKTPQISGTPAVGDVLTCAHGTWEGNPTPTFEYQWLLDGAKMPGAKKESFTVQAGEEGKALTCDVTARNKLGSKKKLSPVVSVLVAPSNTLAPSVMLQTGVVPKVGEVIACSEGIWTGTPRLIYGEQWLREGNPITLATGPSYTVQTADEGHSISCEVTATNGARTSVPVPSSNSLTVPVFPKNREAPSVSTVVPEAAPIVGKELVCAEGTWTGSPPPTLTVQWLRNGEPIESANGRLYTVQTADEGQRLSCEVTGSNMAGTSSASPSSNSLTVPVFPKNIEAPSVGTVVPNAAPVVGKELVCAEGTWTDSPAPTLTVHWLRDGHLIPLVEGPKYAVQTADEGDEISCEVTGTNVAGTSLPKPSTDSEGVPTFPKNSEAPMVSTVVPGAEPLVGAELLCGNGKWSGTPKLVYSYKWVRGTTVIPNANGIVYTVVMSDEGQSVSCEVSASNVAGTSAPTASENSESVPSMPRNLVAPTVSTATHDTPPIVGEALLCSEGTWSGEPTPTYTFQWLRDSIPITGAEEETYEIHGEDEGHTLSCKVLATNTAGSTGASSKGVIVPEGVRKRREEEAAEKKTQEEETKAREAKEQKEKEEDIITSVDNTKGDQGPYSGVFTIAYQPFEAKSTTITYAGVVIGNPELGTGKVANEAELRICTTPECGGTGAELAHEKVTVNNYGLTVAKFKKGTEVGVKVTPGETYYLAWTPPAKVNGVEWVTFWHAGATHVLGSQEMEAIVRGYDGKEGEPPRERISYLGTEPPLAPHVGPFDVAFQNFKAASNKITTLGVVVGNPKLARGAVSGEQIDVRLCQTAECTEGGIDTPTKEPFIVNYGVTEVTIDATVVPGETYFVNWTQPTPVEEEPWVTFWYGQNASLKDASATQAFAKGYDDGSATFKPTYFTEEPENSNIGTFKDPKNASEEGEEIKLTETVQVTCKVFAPEIESVEPEGYWYRIHSKPWNDEYYAAASAFLNGGSGGEPIFTDFAVPDC